MGCLSISVQMYSTCTKQTHSATTFGACKPQMVSHNPRERDPRTAIHFTVRCVDFVRNHINPPVSRMLYTILQEMAGQVNN